MTTASFDDPLDASVEHRLLGQRVTVVLGRKGIDTTEFADFFDDNPPRLDADVTLTGVLFELRAGGDFGVLQDDGVQMWGWPALEIRKEEPRRVLFLGSRRAADDFARTMRMDPRQLIPASDAQEIARAVTGSYPMTVVRSDEPGLILTSAATAVLARAQRRWGRP